ncbi:MAG: CARDB domain-containing protein [Gallionellaceae bacterium]
MRPGSFLKFAFLLSVLAGMPVAHAVFPANNELSTPGTDSTDNVAGAVTDFKTGVMWKQCAEGLPAQTPVCDSSGEQYVHTATPAAGAHAYYFTASADGLNRFGRPASGALSRPMANAQGADLIVSELSSESAGGSVPCGGPITIDDTVANQGNAETTAPSGFLVNYYLSNASVSVLIGNRTISLLGVGSTDGATSTFTLPISLAPGVYQLSAVVDPNDVEPETNESNNTTVAAGSVTVVSNVDLLVTVLDSTPSSVNVGGSITVSDTVANQGTTPTT